MSAENFDAQVDFVMRAFRGCDEIDAMPDSDKKWDRWERALSRIEEFNKNTSIDERHEILVAALSKMGEDCAPREKVGFGEF